MRNRTHLPEYAHGCTVEGRRPSIDRFKVRLGPIPLLFDPGAGREILRHLDPEFFRGTSSSYSKAVLPGALLFGGRLTIGGEQGAGALTVVLDMNLTRFLSRRFEELVGPEELTALRPIDLQAILRNPNDRGRRRRVGESLDNNDNVIPDRILRSGRAPHHLEWFEPYIQAACRFLGDELSKAATRAVADGSVQRDPNRVLPPDHAIRVEVPLMNWSLPQLEIYWEFWSRNAISQAGDMVQLIHRVARDSRMTAWEPITNETDHALLGISAGVGARGVQVKMYAKLHNRIRVEVEYRKNAKEVERVRSDDMDTLNPEGLIPFVARISQRAASRADALMRRAAASAVEPNEAVTQVLITSFFEAIAREAGSAAIFALILRALFATSRVPVSPNHLELRQAMRRLAEKGYFEGNAPGLARSFTSYRPVAPYDRIVQTLQALSSDAG